MDGGCCVSEVPNIKMYLIFVYLIFFNVIPLNVCYYPHLSKFVYRFVLIPNRISDYVTIMYLFDGSNQERRSVGEKTECCWTSKHGRCAVFSANYFSLKVMKGRHRKCTSSSVVLVKVKATARSILYINFC